MPYNIVINGANIKQGGAMQIALSFIKETQDHADILFHVFLGKALKPLAAAEIGKAANCRFYDIDAVPTDGFSSLRTFRHELDTLEAQIKPDAVLTVFGPCYWKPKSLHMMGFANGYLLYEDSPFFKTWAGYRSLGYKLKRLYHRYLLKKEADLYWIETEDARQRLSKLIGKPAEKIVVASNNCSSFFYQHPYAVFKGLPAKTRFRLVYISAFYIHKNFSFIPLVLNELSARGVDAEVVITIKDEDYRNNEAFQHPGIINIGPVHPEYCPSLYEQSDALLMPSLLETFSANYPEAMFMEKPIITTNLPFAKDICGEAAAYYQYDDPADAARKIMEVVAGKALRDKMTACGLEKLSTFDTSKQRFNKILNRIMTDL